MLPVTNMKLISFILLLGLTVIKVNARPLPIEGNDTAKISRLIAAGKAYKLASDSRNLLKTADELNQAGKAANNKIAMLYASLYAAHSAWLVSNYTDALNYSLRALSQSQQWHINRFMPDIYGMIGTVYKENLDYPKAMTAVEKEVQAARQLNDTAAMIVAYRTTAMFMHGYAGNLKDSAMLRQSFELHRQGLALARSNPKFELQSIGYYSNISQYYLEQKDYAHAIAVAKEGIALAIRYKQHKSLTYTYTWLGEAYFRSGQRAKGIAWIEKALALCREHGFIFREMEVYSGLEDCYVRMGDYKNAWMANNRWEAINDSLNIIKNVQKLDELNVKYQTAEKNARIALLDQSAKNKNLLFMIGGGIMLLLVVFTFILYRQKQQVNRYNGSLIAGNKTIQEQATKLELLLKELHHRVKNNLQMVSSLLKLQSNRLTDEDAVHALRDSQQRIEAMSLIHRTLYQQEDSSLVNMRQFIAELVHSLMGSFGLNNQEVDFQLEIDVQDMNIDQALPLGLMINELIINAFKHAYPFAPKPFQLVVKLHCQQGCELEVSDNGPGISPAIWAGPQNSFGIKLIRLLTLQLGGEGQMTGHNGTCFRLIIPPLK